MGWSWHAAARSSDAAYGHPLAVTVGDMTAAFPTSQRRRWLVGAAVGLAVVIPLGCSSDESAPKPSSRVTEVTAEQATKVLATTPGLVVVDVRTPEEFLAGHLAGANNVPLDDPQFATVLKRLDPKAPTLVYCRTGNRSTKAIVAMEKAGFTKLYHLVDGTEGWEKSGRPLVTE